ncbi:hypothetical protein D9619_005115 [Psilocybe cf. subviscida]|uniref:Nephrocystin 3-like N-terminal domain-containing protein n=1 Tax=Psilocybe cf. subviscida TaxID=2480587 RepID=A0A8H5BRU8_9AGAR|nr:hypothetical protein D9619_005115 [Psilocybe cf. subviscida]
MSRSYFDHNRNLQIHGDVNFFATGGSTQEDHDFFQVGERVQATQAQSRAIERGTLVFSGQIPSRSDHSVATYEGFDMILQHTTCAALYGSNMSAEDPGCLHGTRIDVQNHIVEWLNGPESEVAMWMYGPAGIGKTAIAQTVAKLCAEQEQLLSTFFFFRSDEGRNSVNHLVPTLVYGMLQQIPRTHDVVCTRIAGNPLVFSAPLERQIRTILLPALSEPIPSPQNTPPGPMLFIIDGLDECMDSRMQQLIVRLFVSLLASTTTTIRHKILIVSRPESHIVSAFSAIDICSHVRHLCLDEWKSIADIEIFLRAELEVVKHTHPLKSYLDVWWPSDRSFRKLVYKSFESFAYASSAIRYISSHDRHPEMSLTNLVGLSPDCAYEAHAELDTLYRYILESLDEKTRFIVRRILCIHIYLSVDDIEIISSLLGEAAFVVKLAIIKMSSVIRVKEHTSYDDPKRQATHKISYYHTSFSDFLMDKARSGALYLYSPDIASSISKSLSRFWIHPTTAGDYKLLETVAQQLTKNSINVGDMHTHLLRAFLASQLPTTILNSGFFSIISTFADLFTQIADAGDATFYPEAVRSLFCDAFAHMATWLGSQGQSTLALDHILDVIFMPPSTWLKPPTDRPYAWDIVFRIVRLRTDPWRRLRQLLPREETWEICAGMVKRYLRMPARSRSTDIWINIGQERPWKALTGILIHALELAPARAEICRALEQIISEAMSTSLRQITPQDFISFYLTQNTPSPTQDRSHAYALIARSMDLYIRKTHSELDLPYISEDVRRLYCETVSSTGDTDAAGAPPGESGAQE